MSPALHGINSSFSYKKLLDDGLSNEDRTPKVIFILYDTCGCLFFILF